MENQSILGYLLYSLDGMYIEGFPVSDYHRKVLFAFMNDAFDMLTPEEAKEFYQNNSNTNIKEV